ncbi:L-lysine 2,3-aminomutase [Enhygromyxa salina]|uniref:L-lysine 2,3-aminomutase n=1 Tax=Enhygromyxa salina TaxID=215803 RepID=A0A2S9YE85_9BACT|nr:lysine-2,3-aminomutase-like protein [Enhygromyxa salina]PRQ03429.1 L-lysine 2,3-aminomutase [Enhygromyxa salina]
MSPRSPTSSPPDRPSGSVKTAAELRERGLIEPGELIAVERVVARFAATITEELVELINPDDPDDPIAAQFVPRAEELTLAPEELADPIGDEPHTPVPGITHRYPDRVLLKPLHVCPVYCRFCFRREVVGPGTGVLAEAELEAALAYIREHSEIWEVILTGGDPLVLSPRRLGALIAALDAIEHVRVIRIHTRVPVVDPRRINDELLAALAVASAVYVVLHCNHPRELSARAAEACARIVNAGVPMLSQSVLLRGVNADADTLEALFRRLVELRVKPYYLHHGDLARGTGHFRTTIETGQALTRALRGRVSGLCQPTYVLDIPGGHGKVPIGANYIEQDGQIADINGELHEYPPHAEEP